LWSVGFLLRQIVEILGRFSMSVRKTESRLPAGHDAAEFGQAAPAGDGRSVLISFISNPLVVNRENTYVVVVTDAGLAGATQSFDWSLTENGGAPETQRTDFGEFAYTPHAAGVLQITVKLLGAGDAEQASLTLTQDIVEANAELEALIAAARNESGATVTNPDVAREMVNDHNPYYQGVTLAAPESDNSFYRFVFATVSDGALRRRPDERKRHLAALAESLNSGAQNFGSLAALEAGVSGIRLALLAMNEPHDGGAKLIDWTELPENTTERAFADEQVRQRLQALDENARIDLFNIARFPKSNIVHCARILETLRDRYFPGTNFNDVLTGMSATRAHRIIQHYREGPLRHE
jgi:hypothetical protein